MQQDLVRYIKEREMKIVRELVQMGAKPNVARVLVFLARNPKSTSTAIERETGILKTNLTVAMKGPLQQGWIGYRTIPTAHKGRPVRLYELETPLSEIMAYFQQNMENQIALQLSRLKTISLLKG